jgi:N-formylglutamate deformylase
MIDIKPGVFVRFDPVAEPSPIVLDVSRSGREYPCDFRSPASFTDVHDNASMYVEELWGAAPETGATLLYACFPNTYIDVNRGELDLDENLIEGPWPVPLKPTAITRRGLGLLKTVTRYGEKMHERKYTVAEVEERLDRYYRPYHRELARLIEGTHKRFGKVWHLSCHCMSAVGAPTHPDPGAPRTDICLGNRDGTTCSTEFIEFLGGVFRNLGYSVKNNFPYAGGELNARHGDPKNGVESIMVELNKKLFMDVATFRRTEGFAPLRENLKKVVTALAAHTREMATQ